MKSEALQSWLRKLKNAAYDAENVLDQMATEGLRRRVNPKRGMHQQLKSAIVFRFKMAHKVKNIREKIDGIAEERLKFQLSEGIVENRFGETLESRQTCSLVNELEIYGRKEEKEMIIVKLLENRREQDDLSVYAIWGMGGLGKTTLAQLVYNDERTKNHFELRIWVCVSVEFSIERLIREIIESIGGGGCNVSGLDSLQRLLQENLGGRRFLLVLDDVWNENHRSWDGLKQVLKCGSKGSLLMVTTRIEKVAIMMGTIAPHNIGYLSENDSWDLFRKRAFTSEGEMEENLVAIGKLITKKCGGVPLAITALGSLMRYKSHESEWLAIQESEIWHLSDDENGILPGLRLSYVNLLPHMRQCFAYCCIFPKDYEMEENTLIQLWMANGFLPSEGKADLQLTGHLIFKELVWRSFLQDVQTNYKGNTTCKMHDLMHDLAQSVMRHETRILEHGKVPEIPKTLHHLYFDMGELLIPENMGKLELPIDNSLRSFIVHKRNFDDSADGVYSFLSKQQYLRALDMNCPLIEKLPKIICKLDHLRYLTVSCYYFQRLPESLTSLLNLQTLKLTHSGGLLELPIGLKVMKNLWFLELDYFDSLVCTPPGLGDLTCLRTLSIFIVGEDALRQIDQLKELNLGGNLCIKGLENVRNLEDAKNANLMTKKNLISLSLYWTKGITENSAERYEEVLEGLQPHQNLEKIFISSYQGSKFPNWMLSANFKRLNEISMWDCGRCEQLPPLGKLPSLTRLIVKGMDSIKYLGAEWHGNGESSFPALTSLTIENMPNLEEWTIADSIESFPCLKNLDIQGCPKLIGLPLIPTLSSLYICHSSVTVVGSIRFLTSLTSLNLYNFPDLNDLPGDLLQNHKALVNLQIHNMPIRTLANVLDNLSALKTLSLIDLKNLEFLPGGLQHLNSLESLNIDGCGSLASFPAAILETLSSLTSLFFQHCKKLNPLSGPLQRATILQYLLINGCPEVKHLPESVQQLSALTHLKILQCEGLCSLPNWLGNLESLSRIEFSSCENLISLPEGFQSLKSLRELSIRRCPHLEKRCKKPNGEDWPKISHIPIIKIHHDL